MNLDKKDVIGTNELLLPPFGLYSTIHGLMKDVIIYLLEVSTESTPSGKFRYTLMFQCRFGEFFSFFRPNPICHAYFFFYTLHRSATHFLSQRFLLLQLKSLSSPFTPPPPLPLLPPIHLLWGRPPLRVIKRCWRAVMLTNTLII